MQCISFPPGVMVHSVCIARWSCFYGAVLYSVKVDQNTVQCRHWRVILARPELEPTVTVIQQFFLYSSSRSSAERVGCVWHWGLPSWLRWTPTIPLPQHNIPLEEGSNWGNLVWIQLYSSLPNTVLECFLPCPWGTSWERDVFHPTFFYFCQYWQSHTSNKKSWASEPFDNEKHKRNENSIKRENNV